MPTSTQYPVLLMTLRWGAAPVVLIQGGNIETLPISTKWLSLCVSSATIGMVPQILSLMTSKGCRLHIIINIWQVIQIRCCKCVFFISKQRLSLISHDIMCHDVYRICCQSLTSNPHIIIVYPKDMKQKSIKAMPFAAASPG